MTKQLLLSPIVLVDTVASKNVHTLQYAVIFEKRTAAWSITSQQILYISIGVAIITLVAVGSFWLTQNLAK